jgi:[ribosomal protein S18]-alanine N-acetyltransferase
MTAGHGLADLLNILPAHRDDLAAIMILERSGFAAPEQWSERSWLGELLGEGRTVLIARAQQPVGVITIQTTGELADLHRLAVAPAYRRLGVGTALVRSALDSARAVILEVRDTNDAAIMLYQKLGFEQLAARQNYYGPGQHALILKRYDLQPSEPAGPP